MDLSRRDFIKGAFATAATLGLTACGVSTETESTTVAVSDAPQKSEASPETTAAAAEVITPKVTTESGFAPAGNDCTYGTFLNPQDPSGFADSGNLSHVFSPLKMGGVTLKNRIMKSAAGAEMQDNPSWPSDGALAFYGQYADGGVAMICYEASTVMPVAPGAAGEQGAPGEQGAVAEVDGGLPIYGVGENASLKSMFSLDISTDEGIPAHKAIADYMHDHGSLVIAQLNVMMDRRGASSTAIHEFDMETSFSIGIMQTTEEVQQQVQLFIDGAERYYKAGYDGVEINCSCNHIFSTYLSRFANNERTDQYSGETIENRARVVTEMIEGIRERCGEDFVIQVLYSGIEENIARLGDNEACTSIEEACEFAKLFEKAGASSLHIRSQAYGHHCAGFMPDVLHLHEHGHTGYGTIVDYGKHFPGIIGDYEGYGALIDVAAKVKSCVSIPVGTVGSMDPRVTPDLIDNAIADGKIDFILMTRPLMADAEYCNKLQAGSKEEIAPCTRCMTCFVAPYDFGTPMYCRVNAALSRAFTPDMPEGYIPLPAEVQQKVLVIGGGPAGMEAARIAAERGHTVTLLEKEETLGSTLDELSAIKGPHERIQDHKNYLIHQLTKQGVTVRTGVTATADSVRQENPDSVIIAVGGQYTTLNVPGFDTTIPANQLAKGIDGEEFVILGAQFQGCEAAVNLVKQGKKVTVINDGGSDELYRNAATWVRIMGQRWLKAKGVRFYHHAALQEINDNGVVILTDTGIKLTISADKVINALPKQNDRVLFDEVSAICSNVYAVGDCYSASTIANAVARANIVARNIEKQQDTAAALGGDNVYSATASGIGDVSVSIRVENGAITEAVVDTSNETLGIGRELGERYAKEIMEKGSIDGVSGATVTFDAVQSALTECLTKAGLQ